MFILYIYNVHQLFDLRKTGGEFMRKGAAQIIPVDLKNTRKPLQKIKGATGSGSMSDCIRQIISQLEREMEREGIENFVYSDIRICRQ
jgi:hypothetical protein